MKKKIGYFLEDARVSGPLKQIVNISFFLKDSFDQKVLFSKFESDNAQEILNKLEINNLPLDTKVLNSNISIFFNYLIDFFLSFKKIYYEIKKCNFDLVLINGSTQFKFLIICWLQNIKIIWCINDAYSGNFLKFFISFCSIFPDHIVFVSMNSKNYYLKNFFNKKKFSVISSSYNFDGKIKKKNFLKLPNDSELNNKFIVGTMGNISPVKNYEFMIDVALTAKKVDNEIFFLIGGAFLNSQKEYSLKLNDKIKKGSLSNIMFLDYIEDSFAFYNMINIYACYSKSEASPTAVWEAMYFKKPIISSDIGDLKSLNSSNQFGFVIDNYNPDEYLKKILKIKNDKNLFEKLSKSSYLESRNFSANKISQQYLRLFNSFL